MTSRNIWPSGAFSETQVCAGSGRLANPYYNRYSCVVQKIVMKSDARKLKDILTIAEERGLFRGTRNKMVRGRMPEALVSKAKARTGIKSDTELLEVVLANLAVSDDYSEWLLSRRGTVSQNVDLEF